MTLDDRDIACETDYTPLSSNKLLAQIEWHAAAMSGASAYDLERITGPARALLARVEAAEAERNELRERHDNLKNAYANLVEEAVERLIRRLVRMYAAERRVAKLEAQLAAQGWRPVTEEPPLPDEYYLTDDTLPSGNEPWIVNYYSAAHGWANRCRVWLCPPPLPPAAAEATE